MKTLLNCTLFFSLVLIFGNRRPKYFFYMCFIFKKSVTDLSYRVHVLGTNKISTTKTNLNFFNIEEKEKQMSRFHQDIVLSAVKHFAFPQVENFDEYVVLPYKEPPFRHILPNQMLVNTVETKDIVTISKKPEGNREILVGLYDKADGFFHLYSMARNKEIRYIIPEFGPSQPVHLSEDTIQLRNKSIKERIKSDPPNTLNVIFVLDVCRVFSQQRRNFINVILSDIGPMSFETLPDRFMLKHAYTMVNKITMPYISAENIDTIMSIPEPFPYNAENGVVFVQTPSDKKQNPQCPCAKFTPPQFASVYLHVQPVLTLKAHIWKLTVLNEGKAELFKVIPAVDQFYVPPCGAVVSFGISVGADGMWKLFPKHIRVDKETPSTLTTLYKYISRYAPNRRRQTSSSSRPTLRNSSQDSASPKTENVVLMQTVVENEEVFNVFENVQNA